MPLALSELDFSYPTQALLTRAQPLLHRISFQVPRAEIMHISGPNGCGKTTLLKLLAGLFRPDAGQITYAGKDIWSDIVAYQQSIRYLGHKNGMNPGLTAWEHCQLDWHAVLPTHDIEKSLQDLALWSVKDRPCYLLSAGQKRRVALLRLLLSPAQLWLLDEPLVALDTDGVTWLMSCLRQHIAQGGQVIYSSHQALPWQASGHQAYAL